MEGAAQAAPAVEPMHCDLEANQNADAVAGANNNNNSSKQKKKKKSGNNCYCSYCCCLSCFGYQLEDELRLVSLFKHFVANAEVLPVAGGMELQFANKQQLERAQLLAKLLVASNVSFKWQLGRLHDSSSSSLLQWACLGPKQEQPPKLWHKLLKAFCNYFIRH